MFRGLWHTNIGQKWVNVLLKQKQKTYKLMSFNPFQANVFFLNPLKTPENLNVARGIDREHWPGMD